MTNYQVGHMTQNGKVIEVVESDGSGDVSGRGHTVFEDGTLYHAFAQFDPVTGNTGTHYSSYWEQA